MLIKPIVLGFSLLALAVAPAYGAGDKKESAMSFQSLDTDKDGFITLVEVAKRPELTDKFGEHDKDNDGKLSRAEYAAMTSAAAGASPRGSR